MIALGMARTGRDTRSRERALALRGACPERGHGVGLLAGYAGNAGCPMATLAFGAGVDPESYLAGTDLPAPFGHSPFAIARGVRFEASLRRDGYRPLTELLQRHLAFDPASARVLSLRDLHAGDPERMARRARSTREAIAAVLAEDPRAANLLDGAVFAASPRPRGAGAPPRRPGPSGGRGYGRTPARGPAGPTCRPAARRRRKRSARRTARRTP